MFHLRLIDKFKFYLERQLAKGAFYQLLSVWCLVVFVAIVGGTLVSAIHATSEPLTDSVWWAFLRLTDPGYLGDDFGFWRRLIATLLTVFGYVLFTGTLVAIMTQWLFSKMRSLERGLTPVALKKHIAILGWNSRTVPILTNILNRGPLAHPDQSKRTQTRITVLADDITEGASVQFYSHHQLAARRRQVVLRSGSMLNPLHLHRVAAAQARIVVIPAQAHSNDSSADADAQAIKVLMSLNAQCEAHALPTAIVELQHADKVQLARHSYRGPLQLIASDVAIARAFTQSVIQPGVSEVLDSLLVDTDGAQFHLSSASAFEGQTWKDIRGAFRYAIPCGVMQRAADVSNPVLAPADDLVIGRDDALIMLAAAESDITLADAPLQSNAALQAVQWNESPQTAQAETILILGWNARTPVFIEQLLARVGSQLQLTAISTMPSAERQAQIGVQGASLQFIEADYTQPSVLKCQPLASYDSIVVFATDRVERGEEADARSIVTNQLLDLLLLDAAQRPQVLIELTDPNNAIYVSASHYKLRSEVVQSSAIISHLLAQLAVYPELRTLYDHLLSADGVNLQVRRMPQPWHGAEVSFGELQQAVAEMGAVLLGLRFDTERAQLNLDQNQRVRCNETTYLITLGH